MAEASVKSSGHLVAVALAGAWRDVPPALELDEVELEEIAPLLLRSGAAALCWRRVNQSGWRDVPAAKELRQAYRRCALKNALNQQTIERAIALLRSAEVEPILVKGWAAARLYPEPGLRPYGDVDLCVRPEQFARAEGALENVADVRCAVDLHCGFAKFGGGNVEAIYARSGLASLGETKVRVLSAEDHLRILSIHMLREGAWRPLWLCDIASAIEARGADFDWELCLTKNRRRADWVICAMRLAQQLLGASIDETPAARFNRPLPRWLVPTILKEWDSKVTSMSQRHTAPMASFLRYPAGVLKGLRHRWPNPIEATVSMNGLFNELPRLPFQLGNCVARTAKFAAHLPKRLREQ
jgi:Uncharacterised nucleotidyltransferase